MSTIVRGHRAIHEFFGGGPNFFLQVSINDLGNWGLRAGRRILVLSSCSQKGLDLFPGLDLGPNLEIAGLISQLGTLSISLLRLK